MAAPEPLYRLEQVRQQYGGRVVLDIGHLDIARGETLAVIGPSGAGKTTLLRLLQFLEPPSSGALWFDGGRIDAQPPLPVRRRVSTVFQRPVVLNRSVRANLAYGLRVRGRHEDRKEIDDLLDALGLAPLAQAHARGLSGGEIQRVAVGRALAFDPDVLLLDEPTANLDPRNVRLVEDLIRQRHARGATIVVATHQIFQARRLADRIALVLDGQIVEVGPTSEMLDRPRDPRTRAFVSGEMIY
ncbi:MAG: phosphate ABC transporter ATP-binding protein [Acidobacteria bacterium]|nr:MAG: phosphate ABC transporter ATP-binding protein [Acidobacteriota bacterium]RPJ77170.1 MAG: phosphate ABC transporter ATP-binding protein [Acidobacteriota bacterium]